MAHLIAGRSPRQVLDELLALKISGWPGNWSAMPEDEEDLKQWYGGLSWEPLWHHNHLQYVRTAPGGHFRFVRHGTARQPVTSNPVLRHGSLTDGTGSHGERPGNAAKSPPSQAFSASGNALTFNNSWLILTPTRTAPSVAPPALSRLISPMPTPFVPSPWAAERAATHDRGFHSLAGKTDQAPP